MGLTGIAPDVDLRGSRRSKCECETLRNLVKRSRTPRMQHACRMPKACPAGHAGRAGKTWQASQAGRASSGLLGRPGKHRVLGGRPATSPCAAAPPLGCFTDPRTRCRHHGVSSARSFSRATKHVGSPSTQGGIGSTRFAQSCDKSSTCHVLWHLRIRSAPTSSAR